VAALAGCGHNDGSMAAVRIREAQQKDCLELAGLRHDLWPESPADEHLEELRAALSGSAPGTLPSVILVAEGEDGRLVGFVEAGLRSHADGCDPALPVGFLEGWYVAPAWRGRKVGARLVKEAEGWARRQGCLEMASDTWLDNVGSQCAHEALGFEVVDRCVNYRKTL
jgi:aminoglycoside 6'-N-acetyltransferase I